jgi:hypothetical protein
MAGPLSPQATLPTLPRTGEPPRTRRAPRGRAARPDADRPAIPSGPLAVSSVACQTAPPDLCRSSSSPSATRPARTTRPWPPARTSCTRPGSRATAALRHCSTRHSGAGARPPPRRDGRTAAGRRRRHRPGPVRRDGGRRRWRSTGPATIWSWPPGAKPSAVRCRCSASAAASRRSTSSPAGSCSRTCPSHAGTAVRQAPAHTHDLEIDPASRLGRAVAAPRPTAWPRRRGRFAALQLQVNTFHHQAVMGDPGAGSAADRLGLQRGRPPGRRPGEPRRPLDPRDPVPPGAHRIHARGARRVWADFVAAATAGRAAR